MNRRLIFAMLTGLWIAASGMSALAAPVTEKIESDISSRNIAIESNFTGQKIVIFGTIENSRQSDFEPGLYDVVVAIRGPKETIISRRKSQVAGIWINSKSQTFANAPGYYALLSGRELKDITDRTTLNAYGLGFDSIAFRPLGAKTSSMATGGLGEFRRAVVRIKQREGLYIYNPEGIVFVGRNLFRATVDLPANVPVGKYAADVYLLREGDVLSHNRSHLTIDKQGFERFVFSAAFDYPLAYGIIAVIIAVCAGLLASALTRRD